MGLSVLLYVAQHVKGFRLWSLRHKASCRLDQVASLLMLLQSSRSTRAREYDTLSTYYIGSNSKTDATPRFIYSTHFSD